MGHIRAILLIAITTVFSIGLVMIFNTSSAEVLDMELERSTHEALVKQIFYAVLGLGVGWGVWAIGFEALIKMSKLLMILFSLLLLAVLVPGIGIAANGARRWLGVGGYSIQPSEFVKQIIPLFFIKEVSKIGARTMTLKPFLVVVAVTVIPALLILLEPNNGTVAVIGATIVMLCGIMGVRFRYWALPMLAAAAICGVAAYNMPYVSQRLSVYMNPELDILGKGHQPHQAKIAAGSGEFFGKGPGKSLQKLSYLPEAQNDYIAAIFAEEFGFMGILGLVTLYLTITYCGFHIACHAPNQRAAYLAASVTFLISFQAFLNMGVVSGLLPSTGLNLPFFSQGGTSLMVNIAAAAALFDIDRKTHEAAPRRGLH